MATDQSRDIELWREWKRSPSPMNLQRVMDQLEPLIQSEVNRWQGSLPRATLEIEAHRLAVEALKTYRPTGGAKLSTHVMNRLKKLSRLVYSHQNIARIPEHKVLQSHTFNSARMTLENSLGREPTSDELADELKWTRTQVERQQEAQRGTYIASLPPPLIFDKPSEETGVVDFVYHGLDPKKKKVFEDITGYGGNKVLSNAEIMRKHNLTQGQLSYIRRDLTNRFAQAGVVN